MRLIQHSLRAFLAASWLLLAGCAAPPTAPLATPVAAKPLLDFVDLQSFDRELGAALAAPLPKVEVAFYDRITPSALPDRLQQWMKSVQAGGGTVKVVPPESTVSARSPFLLISLLSSLWTASEAVKALSAQQQHQAAQAFDAQIILKTDGRGDSLVDRVIFIKK